MSPEPPREEHSGSDPDILADLMDALVVRLQAGERIDVDAVAREYPAHASEIRRLLPALGALEHLSHSSSSGRTGPPLPAGLETDTTSGCLGDFRLLREVGRGGMGVVYEAEQISLRRRVALKVLPLAAVLDPRQLQRFKNEAQAAACLHHPHIVPVYAVGCERGVHYYSMQFIDGTNLAHVIQLLRKASDDETADTEHRSGSINGTHQLDTLASLNTLWLSGEPEFFRSVARLGIQAAEALEHAHQLGIVHRDIKPANLMVDVQGHLWVTDFGLARVETEAGLTLTGDVMGTLRYMSPEQASGQRVADPRSDVYSLGATLYELLTMKPAFAASHRAELLQQVLSEEPTSPRRWVSRIPADLETILLKSLEKTPSDRYRSAGAFAEDLRRFLAHQPIAARRPTLWQRIGKWSRRNHSLVMLTLAGLVLGLVGFAVSTGIIAHFWAEAKYQRDEARRQRDEARRQRDEARRQQLGQRRYTYALDMHRAWYSLSRGDLALFRSHLNRYRPQGDVASDTAPGENVDVRTFAWYFLDGLLRHRPKAKVHPGIGMIWHLAWSPDGRTIAMVGMESDVVLWDVLKKEERTRLKGHQGEVNCVAFTSDGKYVISAGDDRTIRLWHPNDGELDQCLDAFTMPVRRILVSADGKRLAAGEFDERQARTTVWNLATRKPEQTILNAFPLTFAPNQPLLAFTRPDNSVRLWNCERHQECGVFPHGQRIYTAAFGHKERLLYVSQAGGPLAVWDIERKEFVHSVNAHRGTVRTLIQTPIGLVSAGDDWKVRLWGRDSDQPPVVFWGHRDRVTSVALAPDGKMLASASTDGTVNLWDPSRTPEYLRLTRGERPVGSVAFSPNGRTLVTAGDGSHVCLWDSSSGRLLTHLMIPIRGGLTEGLSSWIQFADFIPEGQVEGEARAAPSTSDRPGYDEVRADLVAVSNTGDIVVVNPETGMMQRWLDPDRTPVSHPVLSPQGNVLAFERNSRIIRRDLRTGRTLPHLQEPRAGANHFDFPTFSPDGKLLACVWGVDHVVIWDNATRQVHRVLDQVRKKVLGMTFSPDGGLLVLGTKDRIQFWEVATGKLRRTILVHDTHVAKLTFSPDGKTLASADVAGRIKIWDVATFQEQMTLWAHKGPLLSLAFSPDSRNLVSAAVRPHEGWEAHLWNAGARVE